MNEAFRATYASTYDIVYADKNYAAECDIIEHAVQHYGETARHRILDLGCGTGQHARILQERGYQVVGVDRSGEMLAQARKTMRDCLLVQADIREVSLRATFDCVLMMFAVLGYQLENDDVVTALSSARNHLESGGLLIFDVWFGPAVLAQRPSDKFKTIPTEHGCLLRASSGDVDVARHVCTVDISLWQLDNHQLTAETHERHDVRFFFPQELSLMLDVTGFSLTRLGAFPDFAKPADESSWNALAVATAV